MRPRLALLTAIAAAWLGCATPPPAPAPAPKGADAALVAAKVEIRDVILRFLGHAALGALFVPVDMGAESALLPSNYACDGYVYLLNARPGRYALVAAFYLDQHQGVPISSTTNVGGGVSTTITVTPAFAGQHTTFFARELIEKTVVEVEASGAAFMGEFDVSPSWTMSDMDPAQEHYFGLALPDLQGKMGTVSKAIERDADRSEEVRARFREGCQESLAEAGWDALLRNPMGAAPPD